MSTERVRAGLKLTVVSLSSAVVTALVVALVVLVFAARTPANSPSGSVPPTSDDLGAPSPSGVRLGGPAPTVVVEERSGQKAASSKTVQAVVIGVGDCVSIDSGPIRKDVCGNGAAPYRVVEQVQSDSRCPGDVDRVQATRQGSLCLDVDWVLGGCVHLGSGAKRIECVRPADGHGVRVIAIYQNTVDVNTCVAGDRGVVYDQRRFVVCVTDL